VLSAHRFRVERIEAALAGLRAPLRVGFLSDLHYGPFVRQGPVAAWVDATLDLAPDLVLLGGDLVDHRAPADLGPLLAQLARLRAPLGVFAVWGNHEYHRFPRRGIGTFATALREVGVTPLRNEGVVLRDDLFLAGLDDLIEGLPDLNAALAGRPTASACLLASHNPDVLPRVPEDIALTLSGHTHGGQVVLPWLGPLVTRSRYGRRFVAGWIRAPALGYVSRGLGMTLLPVRLFCPSELTLATLNPRAGAPVVSPWRGDRSPTSTSSRRPGG